MNRAIKFAVALAFVALGLAGAARANLVANGNTTSHLSEFPITGTPTHVTDWTISAGGKAVGQNVAGGDFFSGIPNGSYSVTAIPDLTVNGNKAFPSNGTYAVSVNFTGNATLNITVEGVTKAATSGQTVTFTVTTFATDDVSLVFTGSGGTNNLDIQSVDVGSTLPEPKSVLGACLLLGVVGCAERRRLGDVTAKVLGRVRHIFS